MIYKTLVWTILWQILHSISKPCFSKMPYYFWTILFGISCKLTEATTDSILSPRFSNFLKYKELPSENSLLDSIVKSFEEQGQLFCIVMIHDEIGMKSNSLSKCKSNVLLQIYDKSFIYLFQTRKHFVHMCLQCKKVI